MHTSFSRRAFLAKSGMSAVGLTLIPRCESSNVAPRPGVTGLVGFPYIVPAKPGDELEVSESEYHFRQFGGDESSALPDWAPPDVDRGSWRLTVEGFVDNPLTLSYDELLGLTTERATILHTLRCVVDTATFPGLVSNTIYTGLPLRAVLEQAAIQRDRTERLYFYGSDGFFNNLLIDEVLRDFSTGDLVEPLLVYEMMGEPLHPFHGFPVRLLVPGKLGYKSIKSLVRIRAGEDATQPGEQGTYQADGYEDLGDVDVMSKITNPITRSEIAAGPVTIFGFALSGAAAIARLELSIDDQPIMVEPIPRDRLVAEFPRLSETIQLTQPSRFAYPYRNVWTLFRHEWVAEPGEHTIIARAVDRAEPPNVQPDRDTNPFDGGNSVFSVRVTVI